MNLPNDIARCAGYGSDSEGWREGCEDCKRRTSPAKGDRTNMQPPPIIAFECEYRIEPFVIRTCHTTDHQASINTDCGYEMRSTDPACTGCALRSDQ